jgi:pyruvate,water dikinase
VDLWDRKFKPETLARAVQLRSVDLGGLSDDQLIGHLIECDQFTNRTAVTHHRFNLCWGLPLGDFLAQATGWTGLDAGELLRLFEGYSGVSRGSTAEYMALRDALKADPAVMAVVKSDAPPEEIMTELLARDGASGEAVRAYVNQVGYRMLSGYDVADMMAIESPEMLLRLIRAATETNVPHDAHPDGDLLTAEIRNKVPPEHRAQFDDLLEEARLTYRIRDERGALGDALGVAVLRRAILAAGERLKSRGKLKRAGDLVDATLGEISGLLRGATAPSADEIHDRAHYRLTSTNDAAPLTLGPPAAVPPLDWYPKSARRMEAGFRALIQTVYQQYDGHSDEAGVIRGLGVYPGIYEGPARVVQDVFDMEKVEQGDVLVSPMTVPGYNVLLPLIGAVVTDSGGQLSHAAIVARECGLPAVVGCGDACARIADGARIRVDGESGEVRILE